MGRESLEAEAGGFADGEKEVLLERGLVDVMRRQFQSIETRERGKKEM